MHVGCNMGCDNNSTQVALGSDSSIWAFEQLAYQIGNFNILFVLKSYKELIKQIAEAST